MYNNVFWSLGVVPNIHLPPLALNNQISVRGVLRYIWMREVYKNGFAITVFLSFMTFTCRYNCTVYKISS